MIPIIGGIIEGITKLGGAWVDAKAKQWQARADIEMARAQHAADWDIEIVRQMQASWKDEILMLIWFSPLVVAWFAPEEAQSWIQFMVNLPAEWWMIAGGIVAATFGLRWFFSTTGKRALEKKVNDAA